MEYENELRFKAFGAFTFENWLRIMQIEYLQCVRLLQKVLLAYRGIRNAYDGNCTITTILFVLQCILLYDSLLILILLVQREVQSHYIITTNPQTCTHSLNKSLSAFA